MAEIYELTLFQKIVKKYVIGTFSRFYGEYIVNGRENIPASGPVIFAPNHVNALMDALAVLSFTPDSYATVYLSRSDLFKKKTIAKILNFFKLMPAFRIRDGYENLGKNSETFDKCVELLDKNQTLCLMPEGNQELEHKIRPLVKGIFRIAFQTQEMVGQERPVKIIPVGVNIEHLVKYGKKIIINIGKPIDVSEYMSLYNENQALAINKIKAKLHADLCELTLNVATDKYYECFYTASEVASTEMLKRSSLDNNTNGRFIARQKLSKILIEKEKTEESQIEKLNVLCDEYRRKLAKYKLRTSNLESGTEPILLTLTKILLLVSGFPVFVAGLLLNFLPFFTPVYVRKKLKIKFEGFFSSAHYGVAILITFPFFYLIQTFLFAFISGSELWLIVLFVPFQYYIGKFAFVWYKLYKSVLAELRLKKITRSGEIEQIQSLYQQIIQQIF